MCSMKGKVVLITGGSGGIGSATARLFAEQGAKVIITSKNKKKLEAGAKETQGLGALWSAWPLQWRVFADYAPGYAPFAG